ncbi:MAG: 50S ribosomal protein L22 [Rickettsiales bacterium]|nr:50S ribosomal protein L22 [Rickettsiales bacterium]|tara:strand:+ start:3594 stop:3971 length:378 start_codon:yes stop_codon:yes gene_type:complete
MSKAKTPRALADNQAKAVLNNIRISPIKLNYVARSIRGLSAAEALKQLAFSPRRVAVDVKKVLQSAIANAENNHDLDVDQLVVKEAYVGKAFVMKRFRARARGRGAKILKPFSNLTIVVEEKEAA